MADPVAPSAGLRTGSGRWRDGCDMPDLEIMMVAVTERAAAGWRRGSAGRGEAEDGLAHSLKPSSSRSFPLAYSTLP